MKQINIHLLNLAFLIPVHSTTIYDGLELSIKNTPITALIEITSVQSSIETNEVSSLISAKLIKSIRGKLPSNFEYTQITEIGDEPKVSKIKKLLSLCEENGRFYSAGNGTIFTNSNKLISHAYTFVKSLPKKQEVYKYCE